jgi:hypothetical protein
LTRACVCACESLEVVAACRSDRLAQCSSASSTARASTCTRTCAHTRRCEARERCHGPTCTHLVRAKETVAVLQRRLAQQRLSDMVCVCVRARVPSHALSCVLPRGLMRVQCVCECVMNGHAHAPRGADLDHAIYCARTYALFADHSSITHAVDTGCSKC